MKTDVFDKCSVYAVWYFGTFLLAWANKHWSWGIVWTDPDSGWIAVAALVGAITTRSFWRKK